RRYRGALAHRQVAQRRARVFAQLRHDAVFLVRELDAGLLAEAEFFDPLAVFRRADLLADLDRADVRGARQDLADGQVLGAVFLGVVDDPFADFDLRRDREFGRRRDKAFSQARRDGERLEGGARFVVQVGRLVQQVFVGDVFEVARIDR